MEKSKYKYGPSRRCQAQNNRDIFYIFKITFFRYTRGRGQRPKKTYYAFLEVRQWTDENAWR